VASVVAAPRASKHRREARRIGYTTQCFFIVSSIFVSDSYCSFPGRPTSIYETPKLLGIIRPIRPAKLSCRMPQLSAVVTGTLELWVIGNDRVTTILADEPRWSLQHRYGLIAQYAIGTPGDLLIHVCSLSIPPLRSILFPINSTYHSNCQRIFCPVLLPRPLEQQSSIPEVALGSMMGKACRKGVRPQGRLESERIAELAIAPCAGPPANLHHSCKDGLAE
jgi:hypothetical protein